MVSEEHCFSGTEHILIFYVFRHLWLYRTMVFPLKKVHSLEELAHKYVKSLAITKKGNVPEMLCY